MKADPEARELIEEAEALLVFGLKVAGMGGRRIGSTIVVQSVSARELLSRIQAWKERQDGE